MRQHIRPALVTLAFVLGTIGLALPSARAETDPAVSNGGYMQTTTNDGKAMPLPLKHTEVQAEVAGFLSSVRVTQTFVNPFDKAIEAVYVFPLPERAAIYGLTMKVGDRTIRGKIKRRQEARRIYEAAKAAGKTAALLDQERPNIFTQSVANILPGEEILVQLDYVENLEYRGGDYEFVFPMVVGPRFIDGNVATGKKGSGWSLDTDLVPDASRITPPLLKKGMRPGNDIMVTVTLDAGLVIEKLRSPTHEVKIDRKDNESAVIRLSPKDTIPNKDFVLRYSVAGKKPRVALLTQKDDRGGHFLLMLQPRVPDAQFAVAPREYVFVIDTSGSMRGFPLTQAKRLMKECLTHVGPRDTFQVIGFAGSASFLFDTPQKASKANVQTAMDKVDRLRGGGGTRFLPALDLALNAKRDPGRSRVVLFLSDGYIGRESEILRYLRSNLKGANLFALGVGSSVNRFLIEGMARMGQGEPFYLLNKDKPEPIVKRFYEYVSRPSLTDIEIDWGGLDVEELTPSYLADLFAERPLFVVGRYGEGGAGKVRITGRYAGRPYSETLEVELPDVPHGTGSGIAYLWARRQIADLMDQHRTEPKRREELQETVTKLALEFNLMSKFTSFVAVDDRVRAQGNPDTVNVAVPLPDGVEESAAPAGAFVGNRSTSAERAPVMRKMLMAPAPSPAMAPPPPSPVRSLGRLEGKSGIAALSGGGGGYGRGAGMASGRKRKPRKRPMAKYGKSKRHTIEKPEARVKLAPKGITVVGGRADGKLTAKLRKLVQTLLPAYQEALERDDHGHGKVTLRLKIGTDGTVKKVTVSGAPFGGAAFKAKVQEIAGRWAVGGGERVIVLKLVFG